jgi:hypothetical protein
VPDETTRRNAIATELATVAQNPGRERSRLVWKGENILFDVIRLPLDMVVLNANSHRIKSQLESESAERRKAVKDDPWSDEAQAIIAEIIERTPGFDDVLAEMQDPGQRDPGVITRPGVLINANTRVVALRKINAQGHVNVMVLQENPDPKDIARLELDLQERRDVKQPYTFTNSLLFIEDLKGLDYSDADVANALRLNTDPKKAIAEVQRQTRILGLIRDIQTRSDGAVPLTHFDNQGIALAELDAAYQSRRAADPDGAELVKNARTLGILTGVEYRHLRPFDSPAKVTDHVLPALTDTDAVDDPVRDGIEATLATADDDTAALPGLDDLGDDGDDAKDGANLSALVDMVAKSYGKDDVSLQTADGLVDTSWDAISRTVAEAIDYAADHAKSQADAEKSIEGPTSQLKEAHRRADSALLGYRKVADDPQFASAKFETELNRLAQVIEAIRAEVTKRQTP